jgi:hypothetical protein
MLNARFYSGWKYVLTDLVASFLVDVGAVALF